MDCTKTIEKEALAIEDKEKAKLLQGFFKTGKGHYGEGDIFLGITVPKSREIAKKHVKEISLGEIEKLIESKYHEIRLIALLLLIEKFKKAEEKERKEIIDLYLRKTEFINNWDLVDLTAPKIIGEYLADKKADRKILYNLAKSEKKGHNEWQWLWEKRISILVTFAFIKRNDFEDAIKLSEIFLKEKHDLMHKATGWALREIGKKDEKVLLSFLDKHCKKMPRTMLRYSIERLSEEKKKYYLGLK